jgi:hypothetical protein
MAKQTRPTDCSHNPPCPNRRACKKYSTVVDREAANLLIASDALLAAVRNLQSGLRTLAHTDVSELTLEQAAKRRAILADYGRLMEEMSRILAVTKGEEYAATPVALPRVH